jgi:predicted DNA-binding protein (MmcQ/YjbR family)
MNIEEIQQYCITKDNVTESFPFDNTTLVFKVLNKMFAVVNLDGETKLTVKCNPETAIELRENFDYVLPAYHFNKKHWNSITIDKATDNFLKEQINNSYLLVLEGIPKIKQKK